MPRVKRGVRHVRHRNAILKHAKGFRWGRKSKLKLARTAVYRAYRYAWRDRRAKKRVMRGEWQISANAFLKERGSRWSLFAGALRKSNIELNRKMIADLAINHPAVLEKVLEKANVSQKSATPA